jgi:transcriptional regulator with XRE-family HTH domain
MSMYSAKQLGQRVLLSRRDLGWDQEQLATASTVSRSRISEIERGKASNVGVEGILSLADALGVSAAYLLGLSDDPLGEGAVPVVEDGLVLDVEDAEQRKVLRQLVDEFAALSGRNQRLALHYLRMMRQVEEEEREHERANRERPPHIVGGAE